MDLTNIPTPTTTPDTDNDTPPHINTLRPFSFTNGTSKNHHYHLHHHLHHHQPPPHAAVTYRECLRNHAANMGGHALDGCGEFMPSPTATTKDPTSLNCAACGCHRNFHRREVDEYSLCITTTTKTPHFLDFRQPKRSSSSPSPPSPPQLQPPTLPYPPPQMLLTLSTAAHDNQQVPNHHHVATPMTPREVKTAAENLRGRKRFRTKFSQEQKEKMQSFAEKMGWKMQKCDDNLVQNFCNEIGVSRGVLKVWMHNNKNTFGRRDISTATTTNIMEEEDNNNNSNTISHHDEEENSDSHNCNNESGDANLDLVLDHNNTNGSSSS